MDSELVADEFSADETLSGGDSIRVSLDCVAHKLSCVGRSMLSVREDRESLSRQSPAPVFLEEGGGF